METGIYFPPTHDVPLSYRSGIPTAEACRSYCECEKDAPFFSHINSDCRCRNSGAVGEIRHNEDVSGVARGCGGAGE